MSDVSFDTHAEIRKLEESGIPLPQAEALVDMVTRAPTNSQVIETLEYLKVQVDTNMATKADTAEIKGELKELNARFDAQNRHVNARFDVQNKHVHALFDAQNRELNARFDAQNKHVNTRFEAQNKEFNARNREFDARFDAQNRQVNALFDAQRKATEAGFATLRADVFRALWLQGSALAALILALAGVMLAFAMFTLSSP